MAEAGILSKLMLPIMAGGMAVTGGFSAVSARCTYEQKTAELRKQIKETVEADADIVAKLNKNNAQLEKMNKELKDRSTYYQEQSAAVQAGFQNGYNMLVLLVITIVSIVGLGFLLKRFGVF